MSTSNIKLLAWASAGILGVLMSGYVFLFFQELPEIKETVSADQMREVLDNVEGIEEKALQKVPYEQIRRSMIDMNWTGKPPEPPDNDDDGPVELPQVNTNIPVERLVRVTMVVGDGDNPSRSFCHLEYLPEAEIDPLVVENTTHGVLFVGEKLPDKLSYVTIQAIGYDGVTFEFDDEARAPETLLPASFELGGGIVSLAEGADYKHLRPGPPIPSKPGGSSGPPPKTYEYRPGYYRLGTEDAEHIAENYSEILSREVLTVKHRDPVTGKYDGVEIRSIAQGSVAQSHGVQEGDVIKSINGQSVSSVSQALNFVKKNADLYDTWEVVIVNKGLERTVTYQSPK